jgi:hypothetical protein
MILPLIPTYVRRMLLWIGVPAVACGLMFFVYERAPPYTFSAFCTYDLTYRLNITVEVAGTQYSSEVVSRQSRSRRWVQEINYAGCKQTYGTALSFRLADNRLLLLPAGICDKAKRALAGTVRAFEDRNFSQAMHERKRIDLTAYCIGLGWDRYPSGLKIDPYIAKVRGHDGFIIDNADRPTRWRGFDFDGASSYPEEHLRIVSAVAEAADISPEDKLDKVAPAFLKAEIKYEPDWWRSPDGLVPFSRRYYPDKKFTYTVEPER